MKVLFASAAFAVAFCAPASSETEGQKETERTCRIIILEAERGEYTTAKRLFSMPAEKTVELCRNLIALIDLEDD